LYMVQNGTGYTLSATASGVTSGQSNAFDVRDAWKAVNNGVFGGDLTSLVVAPEPTAKLYAGFNGLQNALFKSTDAGASWTGPTTAIGNMLSAAADPFVPTTAYHSGNQGVWKTTDGGGTWTLVSGGTPVAITNAVVWSMTVYDDGVSNVVYAGGS